jgi:hypothetical protein
MDPALWVPLCNGCHSKVTSKLQPGGWAKR